VVAHVTPTKEEPVRKRRITAIAAIATLSATGAGVAWAAGGSGNAGPSRLDDGQDLLSRSKITEQQAISAAQTAATGELNEVDLEHLDGKLVWNVDVGGKDVKVDATTGAVVRADQDD
jgi:uncharacterized membrane protein YkoI